jgi:hypothetical protein
VLEKKEQQDFVCMHMFSSLVAHLLAVAHLITKILKKGSQFCGASTGGMRHIILQFCGASAD